MTCKHETREGWLTAGMRLLDKEFFTNCEHKLPEQVQVGCGFPRGVPRAIGVCYSKSHSSNETIQMFICPTRDEPVDVLQILLHEMIHAAVGHKAGHRGPFRVVAKSFGMAGKMTSTYAEKGSELEARLIRVAEALGPYPHAAMRLQRAANKPGKWVRYKSTNADDYRVVVNRDKVKTYGCPIDPWGDQMIPT